MAKVSFEIAVGKLPDELLEHYPTDRLLAVIGKRAKRA
jgi:hypothetical protein